MDRKSKMLLGTLAGLTIVGLFLTYYRSFVSRDYEIIRGEQEDSAESEAESFTSE